MGPLFTLAALAIVGGGAVVATFIFTLFFLPIRSAILFSVVFVGAGVVGCGFGILVQLPFVHGVLPTTDPVLKYLGIIALTGAAFAILVALAFLRIRRAILSKFDAATAQRVFD